MQKFSSIAKKDMLLICVQYVLQIIVLHIHYQDGQIQYMTREFGHHHKSVVSQVLFFRKENTF